MAGLNSNGGMDMSSLAAQLQQTKTKLKGNARANPPPPPPAENSGSSTSSGGSGNYGTIGRTSTGMASMMDEMAKTLARRRAQAEKKPEVTSNLDDIYKGKITYTCRHLSVRKMEMIAVTKNQILYHINWAAVTIQIRVATIAIQ